MQETPAELVQMQTLLDASHAGATSHLRDIINDERTLTAGHIAALMTGMRVLSVATVTATGEPRISALDGHFLHGRWTISSSATSAKVRHLRRSPAVSAACIEGEEVAIFTHGSIEFLPEGHPDFAEIHDHWTEHYGESPLAWGDVVMMRINPTWMVGYAFKRDELLRTRGIEPDSRAE